MGLPNIDIMFRTQASDVIERSQKGTVGMILKDTAATGEMCIRDRKPCDPDSLAS